MRRQWVLSMGAAVVAGAIGGALLSPAPLGAVAKEIVELLAGVKSTPTGPARYAELDRHKDDGDADLGAAGDRQLK